MSQQLEHERLARSCSEWPVVRLKYVARVSGGGTPSKENDAFWSNGDVPWVSPKDMKRRIITETEDYITQAAVDGSATSYVDPGSPLIVVRSGILRHTLPVAIAGRRVTLNQDMKAFRLDDCLDSHFFAYWLEGHSSELLLEWRQFGATVESIDTACMMNGRIAMPNIGIQKAITRFLDGETARIDQLIGKKERFLQVIAEKKNALATQAIDGSILGGDQTGELNWFCRLPDHWDIRKAKFLFRERQDRSLDGDEELLTVSHITGVTRRADKEVNMFLAENMEGYKLVAEGDVVINTMWAWMGAMGVSSVDGLISPSYGVYSPISGAYEAAYLDLLLRSRPFVAEVNRRSKGIWSSRLRLYPDAFLDIRFPVPSRNEQCKILIALQQASEREDQLAELSVESLDRLREFRLSLITAAVSGQIDVESWHKRGLANREFDAIEADTTFGHFRQRTGT